MDPMERAKNDGSSSFYFCAFVGGAMALIRLGRVFLPGLPGTVSDGYVLGTHGALARLLGRMDTHALSCSCEASGLRWHRQHPTNPTQNTTTVAAVRMWLEACS